MKRRPGAVAAADFANEPGAGGGVEAGAEGVRARGVASLLAHLDCGELGAGLRQCLDGQVSAVLPVRALGGVRCGHAVGLEQLALGAARGRRLEQREVVEAQGRNPPTSIALRTASASFAPLSSASSMLARSSSGMFGAARATDLSTRTTSARLRLVSEI